MRIEQTEIKLKTMGSLNIITEQAMLLADRTQAAAMLSVHLSGYMDCQDLIILGIPRGGLVLADKLAEHLSAEMDIVLTRKIRALHNPELAIGAVSEEGKVFINQPVVTALDLSQGYIEQQKLRELSEIDKRKERYRTVLEKKSLHNKVVILTDDGVATGSTIQAAVWACIAEFPEKLVLALPVAPPDTLKRLARDVDDVICLCAPLEFRAISQFYTNFEQVEDEQVVEILKYYSKIKIEE